MTEKKRGLGRGLSALIGDAAIDPVPAPEADTPVTPASDSAGAPEADKRPGYQMIGVDMLQPGAFQPRLTFAEEDLEGLSKSLKEKGVLQPLLVRPMADRDGIFEIVAGERRWRAAQRAQLHQVPVIVQALSDTEALEVAIIENVQRADLNPIEESLAYQRLMEEFSYTQEQLAKTLGKSRSHIANMIRLSGVTDKVKAYLIDGSLSAGHARALLNYPDADNLARKIVKQGLSVRAVEKIVATGKPEKRQAASPQAKEKDVDTLALERSIREMVGLDVDIRHQGKAGGSVTLTYKTLEQLDDVVSRLMKRGV
ncbi:MAG: ParB/RepB/Spo0J family partition protein [Parvibaculales bacterium]